MSCLFLSFTQTWISSLGERIIKGRLVLCVMVINSLRDNTELKSTRQRIKCLHVTIRDEEFDGPEYELFNTCIAPSNYDFLRIYFPVFSF
jgi:hypothetical protein